MVWVDDIRLIEHGPVYPATEPFLSDDFENPSLRDWLLTETGADWNSKPPEEADMHDPHLTTEQPHGGSQCLKLPSNWGILERPFAEPITNCVVTVWFRDVPKRHKSGRLIMLSGENNLRAGLDTHKESNTHLATFLGNDVDIVDIPRDSNWHEAKWEVTRDQGVRCYIDDTLVGKTNSIDTFRSIRLGQGFWGGSIFYVDDIKVTKLMLSDRPDRSH